MKDWQSAYFAQSRSDFAIFQHLSGFDNIPLCHKLHYFQMATEKLAKGFLTAPGAGPYERSHDAFKRFIRVARTRRDIRTACGFPQTNAFRAYVDSLIIKAGEIEDLSPEGDEHPNPEYPWFDAQGLIISPLDHPFAGLDVKKNLTMQKLIAFVETCLALTS